MRASLFAKPALRVRGKSFIAKKSFNSSGRKFTFFKVTLPVEVIGLGEGKGLSYLKGHSSLVDFDRSRKGTCLGIP